MKIPAHARISLVLAPLILGILGCHSANPSEGPDPSESPGPESTGPHSGEASSPIRGGATQFPGTGPGPSEMNWTTESPKEFLDRLASRESELITVSEQPHEGWLSRDDVEELLPYIFSEEPATGVNSSLSSNLPMERTEDGSFAIATSTVGREASFLIDGFRLGKYPPTLCSQSYYDHDPEALEAWWQSER